MIEPREALDAVGQLPDTEIDVAGAAVQLARIDAPDADWQAASAHLSILARDAAEHGAADDPADRARILSMLLGGRHGYAGDTQTYENTVNANLIHVIERKRGLPVALGVLWLHSARAAGWNAHGVDFPGHFLVALEGRTAQAIVDPFAGGTTLDARALRALLKRVEGEKAELRPGLLAPASTRAVLLRLQNNIKSRRLRADDLPGALACAEDMLRFAPDAASLWREVALMHQRLDHVGAALRCFERFLALVPSGEAASRVRDTVEDLRARFN